ncbi:uncharacterized protein LOC132859672 isoform X2 [Tachysurus vachellii]|uniref:uncharacterized protein LOC132859672 isoform X2 n=1 Tax=Tachysurus vachellii TaxID=175792 RepID=UPI00296B1806|nr:uncharacterized protein LOC132859672 isoform X2 [Tachysurus vachellii]
MIPTVLLFLCVCALKPAALKGRVIEVAEGSDVSLNCSSGTIKSHILNTRLKLNTTEYLLLKNFQSEDEGYYECNNGTHQQTFNLELKSGSTNEHLIYFRASEGDSVFFFCKTLSSSSLKAEWSWTPHSSSEAFKLQQNSPHFNQRLWIRTKDNDVSIKISPVRWSDSGKFSCSRNSASKDKVSVFELVLVRVWAEPRWMTPGHIVHFKCELSDENKDFHVLWINTETQETFSNPLEVKLVALKQSWMCGVFLGSTLKVVFPLMLNISHGFTTTPPSPTHHDTHTEPETTHSAAGNFTNNYDTGRSQSHIFIIAGVFITFIFILIAMITAVCCTKTPEESLDSVTYAGVTFTKKSDTSTGPQLNYTDVPAEEETSVLYATVN